MDLHDPPCESRNRLPAFCVSCNVLTVLSRFAVGIRNRQRICLRIAEAQVSHVQHEVTLLEFQIHEMNNQTKGLRPSKVDLEARSLVCIGHRSEKLLQH